jgi:hypothetical protein
MNRHHYSAAKNSLLDHVVGDREQRNRRGRYDRLQEAERGIQVFLWNVGTECLVPSAFFWNMLCDFRAR